MSPINPQERLRSSEEKAKNWINSVNPEDCDDVESVISSIIESSIADSSDSESGEEQQLGVTTTNYTASTTHLNKSKNYTDITELPNYNKVLNLDCVQNQLHQLAPSPTFSNISISNSTNVRFGNTIKIKGNLNINVIESNSNETVTDKQSNKKSETETQNRTHNGVVSQQKREIYRPACLIIPRRRWLAMDPLNECLQMEGTIDLVIISHTATASSTNQPGNIGIIRDMQTLHIETEGWNDIIYNFLIGCDGNVYEGRGWGIEGDHTFGYNNRSIGIAFVGTFSSKLPTERALKSCKNLLIRGVVEGNLSKDYKLVAQCQCSNNDSTGNKLYEEIRTWNNFYDKSKDNDEILDRCGEE